MFQGVHGHFSFSLIVGCGTSTTTMSTALPSVLNVTPSSPTVATRSTLGAGTAVPTAGATCATGAATAAPGAPATNDFCLDFLIALSAVVLIVVSSCRSCPKRTWTGYS